MQYIYHIRHLHHKAIYLLCSFHRGTMHSMQKVRSRGELAVMPAWDTEDWEQWAWGRSESEIVFQRQICKPLEQLVSSFHSDETIPTAAYICLLSRRVLSTDERFSVTANIFYYLAFFPFGSKASLLVSLILCVQHVPFAAHCSLQCASEQYGY